MIMNSWRFRRAAESVYPTAVPVGSALRLHRKASLPSAVPFHAELLGRYAMNKPAVTQAEVEQAGRSLELIHKAADLFFEFGFRATTMNQIAQVMGLTKPSLYHYISSKADLLFDVLTYAMDTLEMEIVAPAKNIDHPRERLEFVVEGHLHCIASHGGRLTIAFDEARHLPGPLRKQIQQRQANYFEFVCTTLAEIKQTGELRSRSVQHTAAFILMTIYASARWFMEADEIDMEFTLRETASFILDGALCPA